MREIKVFDTNDKSLKILGELLSNDTSRKIIKALIENEMYTNEIATKLDLRVSLVIHHLKKLEELGLLKVIEKPIIRKGNNHRYFTMIPKLVLLLKETKEEIEEKGILRKIFQDGIKFASIAIAFSASLFVNIKQTPTTNYPRAFGTDSTPEINLDIFVIPLIIVIIGLIIERILSSKKRKKS